MGSPDDLFLFQGGTDGRGEGGREGGGSGFGGGKGRKGERTLGNGVFRFKRPEMNFLGLVKKGFLFLKPRGGGFHMG